MSKFKPVLFSFANYLNLSKLDPNTDRKYNPFGLSTAPHIPQMLQGSSNLLQVFYSFLYSMEYQSLCLFDWKQLDAPVYYARGNLYLQDLEAEEACCYMRNKTRKIKRNEKYRHLTCSFLQDTTRGKTGKLSR